MELDTEKGDIVLSDDQSLTLKRSQYEMAPEATGRTLSDEEVFRAVRWRFRICNYLFTLGAAWMVIGIVGHLFEGALHTDLAFDDIPFVMELIGLGIFSAAFVLTLAI